MLYRAIGLMSGSSLDGLDIAYTELEEKGGQWSYEIKAADCIPYSDAWRNSLQSAAGLPAYDYLLLHTAYGRFMGEKLNEFIQDNGLEHKVQLIASHGHTVFHAPEKRMTAQLGDGASIAAITGINVVSDLRNMDVALGGQGAPIVPTGENLLFKDYGYCLNLGGIANISVNRSGYIAFDICPANRVLNMLANKENKLYDMNGEMAAGGKINNALLEALNNLEYYSKGFPKSLSNEFGTAIVFPLIESFNLSSEDALRTYTEHIVRQTGNSLEKLPKPGSNKMLVTGGGAFNSFLIQMLKTSVNNMGIELVIPEKYVVEYKEALIMALLGILRWREEYNVLQSVTGASRSSIGGAVWIGQEA